VKQLTTLALLLALTAAANGSPLRAPPHLEPRTREALIAALNDERHARALFRGVVSRHGPVPPFADILRAQDRREALLLPLFRRHGVPVPPDPRGKSRIPLRDRLPDACASGAEWQKANIALYDGFLAFVRDPDIRDAFTRRREASRVHHLPAFERCARRQRSQR
jgi:hypothetical protein